MAKARSKDIDLPARAVEVRLPASTSNLGAGFDCFGLALQLYLTIRATVMPQSKTKCRVRTIGSKESASLPRTAENLIYRAMAYAAGREGLMLPAVYLTAHNPIPISRGLGSSAAAIVGGIKLCGLLAKHSLPNEKVLQYASEFEGHPDNIAASLLGGFVITSVSHDGKVIAVKRPWPADIKILIVSPKPQVVTRLARANLPRMVERRDAVYNLQRSALFTAALAEHRYESIWEAMQDRLHQHRRQALVPGVTEALALRRMPGLLGLALSGAGPSVLALAENNLKEIGEEIEACFRRYKLKVMVRQLEVDTGGCETRVVRAGESRLASRK